jgi:hypothetical protein
MIDIGHLESSLAAMHSLDPALWFLVADAGHAGCNGWTFDRRDGLLRCACGTALYQFHEIDRQRGGSPASPSRPGAKGSHDDPG